MALPALVSMDLVSSVSVFIWFFWNPTTSSWSASVLLASLQPYFWTFQMRHWTQQGRDNPSLLLRSEYMITELGIRRRSSFVLLSFSVRFFFLLIVAALLSWGMLFGFLEPMCEKAGCCKDSILVSSYGETTQLFWEMAKELRLFRHPHVLILSSIYRQAWKCKSLQIILVSRLKLPRWLC